MADLPGGSDGVTRMVQEQRAGKPMGLRSLSSLVYSSSHKDWSCWQGCPRHRKQTPCAPSLRVLRVSVCIRPAHAEARSKRKRAPRTTRQTRPGVNVSENCYSSWFLVPGSWFSVPGSWFLVLGSQFLVLSSRFSVLSSWFSVLDTRQSISISASSRSAAAP